MIFAERKEKARKIKINKIVLNVIYEIENDNLKRIDWPIDFVEHVIPGRNSEFRLVRLKTTNRTVLRPSMQQIY